MWTLSSARFNLHFMQYLTTGGMLYCNMQLLLAGHVHWACFCHHTHQIERSYFELTYSCILDPTGWHPLWFPLQAVDLINKLMICSVCIIVNNDHIKEVTIFVFHFTSLFNNILQFIFLQMNISSVRFTNCFVVFYISELLIISVFPTQNYSGL